MKCPYNNFEECFVEQCPACVYEDVEEEVRHYTDNYVFKNTKTGNTTILHPYYVNEDGEPSFVFNDKKLKELNLELEGKEYTTTNEIVHKFKFCKFIESSIKHIDKKEVIRQKQIERYGKLITPVKCNIIKEEEN